MNNPPLPAALLKALEKMRKVIYSQHETGWNDTVFYYNGIYDRALGQLDSLLATIIKREKERDEGDE